MVSPKQLSDETLPLRKSTRIRSSKRVAEAEEESKKNKKTNLASPVVRNRIWSEDDELVVLKGLVAFKGKTGTGSKIDWEAFFRFIESSFAGKFSKDQVYSKVRKLRKRFFDNLEKIKLENDSHSSKVSDSEAFGLSMMLWGQNEDEEPLNDNGVAKVMENETVLKPHQSESGEELVNERNEVAIGVPVNDNGTANATVNKTPRKAQQSKRGKELFKEHNEEAKTTGNETALKAQQSKRGKEVWKEYNEAAKIMENKTALKAQQSKSGKEVLKEHNEAAKIMENKTTGKESQDDYDELGTVRDAFETMIASGLSDHQKKLQLQNLMNLETGMKRKLADEWKALRVKETKLQIKKLLFSAKLTEAAHES